MSNRYFEDCEHTSLYQQYRPKLPQQVVHQIIHYLTQEYKQDLKLAVDVGCGSGQSTFLFGNYFEKVYGLDVSPNQIEVAKKFNEKENLHFEVSVAETLKFQNSSVQLVTTISALHWFDIPKFFEEVQRVLCPNGVLAAGLYAVQGREIQWPKNPLKNSQITRLYHEYTKSSPLFDLCPPQMMTFFDNYRDIMFPFNDFVSDEEAFILDRKMNLVEFTLEIQTWPSFQKFKETQGSKAAQDLLFKIENDFMAVIADDLDQDEKNSPEKIDLIMKIPIVLLMGRKCNPLP